jgi:hypothetical protein
MTPRIQNLALFAALGLAATNPGVAHPGGLDGNGCHYKKGLKNYHCHQTVAPNPDRQAPVKKSRDNICHDETSPNWKTIKFFVRYETLAGCLTSGGRRHGS